MVFIYIQLYFICFYLLCTERYKNLYLINQHPWAEPHCEVARIHPLAGKVTIPHLHFPQFNYHACRMVGTVHSPSTLSHPTPLHPIPSHPYCDSSLRNWLVIYTAILSFPPTQPWPSYALSHKHDVPPIRYQLEPVPVVELACKCVTGNSSS